MKRFDEFFDDKKDNNALASTNESNMSYCRFENTYRDLQDCYQNMDNNLSETEKEYRKKIIDLCKDIVDDFGDDEHEFFDDTTG